MSDLTATPFEPVDDGVPVQLRCSVVLIRERRILMLHRRSRGNPDDGIWILPGGNPRAGESMQACAIRETAEESGLHVTVGRCLFVYEIGEPESGARVVELVFAADSPTAGAASAITPDAEFVPLDQIRHLNLRPPIAGHLARIGRRATEGAYYLGNMWRPEEKNRKNRHQLGLVGEAAKNTTKSVRLPGPTPQLLILAFWALG
jgi:8-oxo-dGTP diphosphatase